MAAICAAAPLALANQLQLPTIEQRSWSRHCRCKQHYRLNKGAGDRGIIAENMKVTAYQFQQRYD